ncbi:hypothetical protein QWY93_05840 [Echinicola jeungdonensis]|uniref:Dolichyl-phosphate-mannose-protein mannosyltransferase n=1 Tax=Echinicola jeungdonensis TaxID=709343 RepID=A0ABV5J6H7_9BACT|nr:hypothetical protein [Echinicola jeungdonensis]MDN3668844.1 hypothetical protein [Echinicola jeungdonensis]
MDIPLLSPELTWMLIGERMSEGHYLYVDIIDDIGPLSAYIYWLIDMAIGRSWWTYKILASLVILFQITYINRLFIAYRAFEDNTYIPALVLIILFHLSFDFLTLSPALMGTTFIILALGQLFSLTLLKQESTESVLMVGIFGGIATCFHFPLAIFLPFLIFTGIMVSGFSFNQLVLSLVGYFQPLVFCGIYFFWIDAFPQFISEFILATRITQIYPHVGYLDLVILLLIPMAFTFGGYFIGTLLKSITVNQQKQKQLMVLFLIFALLSVLLANHRTPYQMVVILPGMTYFIAQIYIYLEKRRLINLFFYLFLILVPSVGYFWSLQKIQSGKIYNYAVNEVPPSSQKEKILVLGDDISLYQNATLATPYLNFRLSKRILTNYDDFDKMSQVYLNFKNEKPAKIFDREGVFQKLLQHLLPLQEMYQEEENGIYSLKTNTSY